MWGAGGGAGCDGLPTSTILCLSSEPVHVLRVCARACGARKISDFILVRLHASYARGGARVIFFPAGDREPPSSSNVPPRLVPPARGWLPRNWLHPWLASPTAGPARGCPRLRPIAPPQLHVAPSLAKLCSPCAERLSCLPAEPSGGRSTWRAMGMASPAARWADPLQPPGRGVWEAQPPLLAVSWASPASVSSARSSGAAAAHRRSLPPLSSAAGRPRLRHYLHHRHPTAAATAAPASPPPRRSPAAAGRLLAARALLVPTRRLAHVLHTCLPWAAGGGMDASRTRHARRPAPVEQLPRRGLGKYSSRGHRAQRGRGSAAGAGGADRGRGTDRGRG